EGPVRQGAAGGDQAFHRARRPVRTPRRAGPDAGHHAPAGGRRRRPGASLPGGAPPMTTAAQTMDHLDQLEAKSVHIFREAYANFKSLCMLWSIGKDSTVLLWLARKAFYGHVPFPLVHIDTSFKIAEMIQYRDRLAAEWNLNLIYGQNLQALQEKRTFPDGAIDRIACCGALKTEALKKTLSGEWPRWKFNHAKKAYEIDKNTEPYTGVIV